jgi:hypothetical protein
VVAHRRAGKSVAEINEMIRAALRNTRVQPPPRYAYVGPSFAQTKDLIWGYLKHYTDGIPGRIVSEGELYVEFPGGKRITLYGGAAAYERMRGLYFDGVVMDEFPLLAATAWSTVVRPCLADYRGWAIVSGTSNGEDHFYKIKLQAENDNDWDSFEIPVTNTDALHPDEIAEMTKDMSPDEFAREMMCSFSASVEGAYYGEQMNNISLEGRILPVPYDNEAPVWTCWDIGIDDSTAVWFLQRCGREIHVIEYLEQKDKLFNWYFSEVKSRPYIYGGHIFPQDIKVRELIAGSRYLYAQEELGHLLVQVCPPHSPEDGIVAVRRFLGACFFDAVKTKLGVVVLRSYHKNPKTGKPVHDKYSHGADSLRQGAVYLSAMGWDAGWGTNIVSIRGALKRRIGGVY